MATSKYSEYCGTATRALPHICTLEREPPWVRPASGVVVHVGCSPNIIETSWLAVSDSLEYWLVRRVG
ncbi:MAG: hypothetical protein WEB00_14780 [Dehalococcoidia bacterium]